MGGRELEESSLSSGHILETDNSQPVASSLNSNQSWLSLPKQTLGRSESMAPNKSNERYGYDGMGPYDGRGGQGGRGYGGDERGQGRHGGSRSNFHGGPPADWPGPGRTGFSDGPYSTMYGGPPSRREGLMSYKQFIAELEDDILPAEAERRYEEYKAEFITTQKRAFFEQHKDDDWLREKYDPSRLEAVLSRRNENAKTLAKDFQTDLQAGNLDVGPTAVVFQSAIKEGEPGSEEEVDAHGKRRKQPGGLSKDREFDAAPKAPSALADAKRVPKDIDQARALIKKLDAEKGIEGNILLTSGNSNLEGEKSMSGVSLGTIVIIRGANQVKGLEGLELMDVMLTYLWRIHSLDYYGMVELKDAPKGLRHVRGPETKGGDESALQVAAADWEKKLDSMWQSRLQGQDLIEAMLGRDKLEATANEALDPFVRKIRDEKYGWKYGCGAKGCTKLFHGPEYVHKHLKLKHSELVSDVVAKAREELYFQNYMNDADAPGANQSFTSQPGPREKNRRRRTGVAASGMGTFPGGADRMSSERNPNAALPLAGSSRGPRDGVERFDRGGGRENERSDRVGHEEEQRYDRGGDHSPPSRDFATMGGGAAFDGGPAGPFEGGPSDTPMFDPFSGPPLRGPPFGSDIPPPPPVLMPVPGAGPLGPFVPAPPEVAMRMLREQGGPPPFHPGAFDGNFEAEGNGGGGGGAGPRGRKGRGGVSGGHGMGGGMMDNAPMMLPLSQSIRHDPRNVRSYHDLDAPEDEVTVIDYRSL
ncbi:protein MpSE [Marchantia polymorpha subsp. ruderalis]|nr:hypothetical protein MARPO_0065s0067 [Marchantia polymorpha]PTQ36262.1 hypothetical protein MARPO_0065s0067 [Marchantia polymorpha]BBM99694.1 hypothetical protein Mp_1g23090 [Marchantia polymorpha subsp. ruderalis]BBM99695.1 hypothetical protein Mp_1g23090 [Marchantia polymorpha subsp. ruderalis]|eukprot:PTQ36261.1 hypothetical protein MARPO_0065s0067 [Marchantia polymorpha]